MSLPLSVSGREADKPELRCVIVDTGEEERLERFPLQLRLDPLLRSRLCVWKRFQVAAFALCRGQTEAGFVSALCPLGRKSLSRTCSTALYILQIHCLSQCRHTAIVFAFFFFQESLNKLPFCTPASTRRSCLLIA